MRRKWFKRIGFIVVALVAFVALNLVVNVGLNSAWYASMSRVPVPEASYAVEIRRDSWGVPHIELDALHWGHGWKARPEFRDDLARAMDTPRWIADGNYRVAGVTPGAVHVFAQEKFDRREGKTLVWVREALEVVPGSDVSGIPARGAEHVGGRVPNALGEGVYAEASVIFLLPVSD